MLSINNAFKIIGPYEYMAAIDLTDAFFFSIPIHSTHQKYLKFKFYHLHISIILCMPNGHGPAIRVFTKRS